MNDRQVNFLRGLKLAIGAIAIGLMISTAALAQRGGGGHGGGGGGGGGGRGGGGGGHASSAFGGGRGGGGVGASHMGRSGGGNLMSGNSFSSGSMQRGGGSMNLGRASSSMNSIRGNAPSTSFSNRSFSGAGNSGMAKSGQIGGGSQSRRSGGFNGDTSGSTSFVQKNFGGSLDQGRGNSTRKTGAAIGSAQSSRGNSDFISRNFNDASPMGGGGKNGRIEGRANNGAAVNSGKSSPGNSDFISRNFKDAGPPNGGGKSGRANSDSVGQRSGGPSKNFDGNSFAGNRNGADRDSNKGRGGNQNNWNGGGGGGGGGHGDWNDHGGGGGHGDWNDHGGSWNGGNHWSGSGSFHRPFCGYVNYPYFRYPFGFWFWPSNNFFWGFGFGGWWPSCNTWNVGFSGGSAGWYGGGYSGGYGDYVGGVSTVYDISPVAGAIDQGAIAAPIPSNDGSTVVDSFVRQGEAEFRAGNYEAAARAFRHALVDNPNNGAYMMILGQALFATGQFGEAAGATQQAAQMLPQDKWGTIVANYRELYTNIGDYTSQLRALEKARNERPDDPALRFLLGWHYGYLGFPTEAVRELNKTLELVPADQVAKKLRAAMNEKIEAAKLPTPEVVQPPVPSNPQ